MIYNWVIRKTLLAFFLDQIYNEIVQEIRRRAGRTELFFAGRLKKLNGGRTDCQQ
jgi:hypothetical protein